MTETGPKCPYCGSDMRFDGWQRFPNQALTMWQERRHYTCTNRNCGASRLEGPVYDIDGEKQHALRLRPLPGQRRTLNE